ncbi:MAG: carboxypeptidase regulatory-like domain-containing protein [Candidatus Acidiferrum sp.]|jgi:hypothetical protein
MRGRQGVFAWITLCLLVLSCAAMAAGQVNTATLSGTVTDQQGLGVKGAKLTLTNAATGLERTAFADEGGRYKVVGLPPGKYKVRTEGGTGFSVYENDSVVLTVGEDAIFDLRLELKGVEQTVQVTTDTAPIETAKTEFSQTVGEQRIDNLPINGRNYINFTLTDSQVTRDNAPNTGAAPTSGLNISGQNGRSNIVNVDGADATDNAVNGVRSTVSQEAVQEFQIITNGYAPEYGRASGGVVNIITKSGANEFHGDVFGYLRNRDFQATNPFSTVPNPAYTRVQAGTAFGGPIKKDKTFYFFSYEITRRHETGFSSIGQGNYGLTAFDTTQIGLPFGTLQLTPDQVSFLTNPATLQEEALSPAFAQAVGKYVFLAGASSGMAVNGVWPQGLTGIAGISGFPTSCTTPPCFVPASYQDLVAQQGNFPIFEGTSLYSLRIDHAINANNHLMLRSNVSPSTVTGIEVAGQDQPYGQNAYSRTSQQTYRDVAGVAEWVTILGNNKVNEFRFQYARRGLLYNYSSAPGGSDPAINITGYAYFGREPYSYIQRVENRYQFTDNFSWTMGSHATKFGVDVNYIPTTATFTVNYGGVYDFGAFSAGNLGFPATFPSLNPVQAYGAGLPADFVQGIGSPSDSFKNIPLGAFWQDSWQIRHNLTLNYGVRYDIEFPPTFAPPDALALQGYNILGLQKGIQTDTNNVQPRVGIAWDPKGDGRTVVRASYGLFYDHPLLGLYFLGDASDGSKSVQLAFGGTAACTTAGDPGNLNAIPIFQGLLVNPLAPQCAPSTSAALNDSLGYLPNQQRFQALNFPNSLFIDQNYVNAGFPLGFQPFGYPQGKNFVYAYSEQANLSVEHDFGHGFVLNVAYNFNEGHHINRPINANAIRGDLMVDNLNAAVAAGVNQPTDSPFLVTGCGVSPGGVPYVPAALVNFFRPSGLNPAVAEAVLATEGAAGAQCIGLANQVLQADGLNSKCNPAAGLTNCVPFSDMDANFSNGNSIYNGLTVNMKKRFSNHYEFLASYTWAHTIDDATDLQATLTPQDSFFPNADRSSSTFDQRHRFVFSGVYQSGRLRGDGFASKFFSNWTVAPLVELASGRPFNIVTGVDDNLQLSALTGRPNTFDNVNCGPTVASKFSPTGIFQEPCFADFNGTLQSLDGNVGRNTGLTPWVAFADMRIAKRLYFGERYSLDLITDMFNLPNRFNVSAVNVLWTNAGQPTASYDPRQFQFAMKFNW